jgi:protein subunit release factor A
MINKNNLHIETYRIDTVGGQHISKVVLGVKVTHRESGQSFCCETRNSTAKNMETALKILSKALGVGN